jgi:hypothetical protein
MSCFNVCTAPDGLNISCIFTYLHVDKVLERTRTTSLRWSRIKRKSCLCTTPDGLNISCIRYVLVFLLLYFSMGFFVYSPHPVHVYICVRNRTFTLIEREDDTRSWGNFLIYFSHYHNVMPFKELEIHTYRLLASQEYARC